MPLLPLPLLLLLLLLAANVVHPLRHSSYLNRRYSSNNCVSKSSTRGIVHSHSQTRVKASTSSTSASTSSSINDIEIDVSDKDIITFMTKGHLFKKSLIPIHLLNTVMPEIQVYIDDNILNALKHKVEVTLGVEDTSVLSVEDCQRMLAEVDTSYIPFLQLFNIWKHLSSAKSIALHSQLGKVAAHLLGVDSVRLYQDSLFVKRSGDGATLWHTGRYYP
jgi:hypothetical protein